MKSKYSLHIKIFILLLLSALNVSASDALQRFLASPSIDSASTAILITDLSTGETIESLNPEKPLIPASIMKAVTIASLIRKSGIDYTYKTKVYISGKISDGILNGNLIIEGSGDPSLNAPCEPRSADFVQEVAQALKEEGITEVKGRIIFDEDIFSGPATHPSWGPGDLRASYGTGAHGFNFEANRNGKAAVQNPASVFESKLKSRCTVLGISFSGESVSEGSRRLIATHTSPTIDEIMRSCMMRSDNLFAESLLRTLAILKGKEGSTESGARLSLETWKRLDADTRGVVIADGSGLSRRNRVTAQFMTDVLRKMSMNVDYASFFPLAGQEGTLRSFLSDTPLNGYVALKTGSMSGIQCYAGYLLDDNYAPTHTIVFILNAMPKGRNAARKEVASLLLDTFCPKPDTSDTTDSPNQ